MPTAALARWSLIILAACGGFAALRLGQSVFAPLLMAFVIGVVLAPLTDLLARVGLPRIVATLIGLSIGIGVTIAIGLVLEPVIWRIVDMAPIIALQLRDTLSEIQGLFGSVGEMAIGPATPGDAGSVDVTDAIPSLTDAIFLAPSVVAQMLIFIGTLFFFLLSRVEVYDYLSRHRVLSERPRDVTRILLTAERRVSRYFVTITIINAGFGTIIGTVMYFAGMPSPALWGAVAFMANFILYLGPITLAAVLVVAGAIVFDGLRAFLPAALFISINAMEGQFVTPALVGRQLSVNPLLVFLSLVFWLWLWGPIGGIVAIPLLVWIIAVSLPGDSTTDPAKLDAAVSAHRREAAPDGVEPAE